jgi:hypothetical protein
MKNDNYYLLLGLVFLFICININQGTEYELHDINKCYGDVDVKVKSKLNKTIDYAIKDCDYNGSIWKCGCKKNNTPIILQTRNTTKNSYYIMIQYHIKPVTNDVIENENHKRNININNINIGDYSIPVKPPLFKINIIMALIILSIVMLFISGLVVLLIYLFNHYYNEPKKLTEYEYRKMIEKWKKS